MDRFSKNIQIPNFVKLRPAFRSFANVSKNMWQKNTCTQHIIINPTEIPTLLRCKKFYWLQPKLRQLKVNTH